MAKYEVEVEVDAQSAIAALERLRASTERVGAAASQQMTPALRTAAEAQAKAEAASKANAEQLNKNLTAAAALGAAFGTMSAQLGPVGQALGAAASSAGALYAAMGPVGAVIGGIAGALPGLISAIDQTADSSARAANNLTGLQNSVVSLADEVSRATAEYRRFFAAVQGTASAQEVGVLLAGAREGASRQAERVRELQGRLDDFGTLIEVAGGGAGGTVIAGIRAEIELAQREQRRFESQVRQLEGGLRTAVARAEEERAASEAQAEAQSSREARRARGGGAQADPFAAATRAKAEQVAIEQKQLEIANEILDREEQRLRIAKEIAQAELDAADAKDRAASAARAAEKAENERLRILAEETGKAKQLAIEEREEQEERTRIEEDRIRITSRASAGLEGVLDIAKRTAEIQRESNASVGEAFKTAVDEWLKGFALQSAYKGVAATAEAIGSAVTNQPNAAAKFAEAGIHFALAAAAGGASAAIPNAGGGGGGGGGGGRQGPEAVGGGGGATGGGTVVVNFNSPVAEAEIGRQQERASRAARRRFGS